MSSRAGALAGRRRALAGRRRVVAALVLVLVVGFALRAHSAVAGKTAYQSTDEYSYVAIAQALADDGAYGRSELALRWPPGAPFLFAAAQKLDAAGVVTGGRHPDIPSAYWAQAVVGTVTILVVFALVALLAGALPALLAALVTALYPPLITVGSELLSEPLGAAALALAMAAAVWAVRGAALGRYLLAGVLLGLAVLVRADYLFMAVPLGVVVLLARRGTDGLRRAAAQGLVLAAATGLTLLPWTIYVSGRADKLTPVTTGDGPVAFVGTYLPGDGTSQGMRRALGPEASRLTPDRRYRGTLGRRLPAGVVLDVVAARHPGLDRSAALRKEAVENLRYDIRHPVDYAGMTFRKVRRMWTKPSRIGSATKPGWVRALHIVLVVLALVGLLAGLIRTRSAALALLAVPIAYGTLLHAVLVAQPRYNLPLMPLVFAAGVAGAVLALRTRTPATLP